MNVLILILAVLSWACSILANPTGDEYDGLPGIHSLRSIWIIAFLMMTALMVAAILNVIFNGVH